MIQKDTSARFFACEGCGKIMFPKKLICPVCASDAFTLIDPGAGLVQEKTVLRDGIFIYSVLAGGVAVTCSSEIDISEGSTVTISNKKPKDFKASTVFLPNS